MINMVHAWVSCLFDLEKAFNSIELSVLLDGYSTLAFEADFGRLSTIGTSQPVAIFHAINRLKCGKVAGSGKLQPEHIKHGGHTLELWLRKILNRSKYVNM